MDQKLQRHRVDSLRQHGFLVMISDNEFADILPITTPLWCRAMYTYS